MNTLFDMGPPKHRAKPRVLMHVIDAGECGPGCDEHTADVRLQCRMCGYATDWTRMLVFEAKRGVPCPKCNQEKVESKGSCANQ